MTKELDEPESPYCRYCNSCGHSGCCFPNPCPGNQCKYAAEYAEEAIRDRADASKYFDKLMNLGVYPDGGDKYKNLYLIITK